MNNVARGNGVDNVTTNHLCDVITTTEECSSKVYVEGTGVVREDDYNRLHTYPVGQSCVNHKVMLSSFSNKVFVESKGIGRKGDLYGTEEISTGSSKVYAGG